MDFSKEDIICGDKFLAMDSSDGNSIAYHKQDVFVSSTNTIVWRGRIHTVRPAQVWISGHSDYGITDTLATRYQNNVGHWFTTNKETQHSRLYSIPLGITNDCADSPIHHVFGNMDVMVEIMREPRIIRNTLFMNFSINTYPTERKFVFDVFHGQSWVTEENSVMTMDGRRRFLQSIRNHQFVLCPRGNGVDTHRLWETLYMGSIPIVKRHVAMEEFADLPICWIDRWTEVTPEFLKLEFTRITETTWNLEKLTFTYWKNRILSVC